MTKQQQFIDKLKNHAIRGWVEYKILPSLTISQAILETGWGDSVKIPNNLFGIKADSRWTGKKALVDTKEEVNGKTITVKAWFRVYDSIYESLEDRYNFLQATRYKKLIGEKDYRNATRFIYEAGYATDSKYPSKLNSIIEQYKLHEIDRQAFNVNMNTSGWATDGWLFCLGEGLMDGTNPKNNLSREQLALILQRVVK